MPTDGLDDSLYIAKRQGDFIDQVNSVLIAAGSHPLLTIVYFDHFALVYMDVNCGQLSSGQLSFSM